MAKLGANITLDKVLTLSDASSWFRSTHNNPDEYKFVGLCGFCTTDHPLIRLTEIAPIGTEVILDVKQLGSYVCGTALIRKDYRREQNG